MTSRTPLPPPAPLSLQQQLPPPDLLRSPPGSYRTRTTPNRHTSVSSYESKPTEPPPCLQTFPTSASKPRHFSNSYLIAQTSPPSLDTLNNAQESQGLVIPLRTERDTARQELEALRLERDEHMAGEGRLQQRLVDAERIMNRLAAALTAASLRLQLHRPLPEHTA